MLKPSKAQEEVADVSYAPAKEKAAVAIDIARAAQAVVGVSAYTLKPDEAQIELDGISDPALKQEAQNALDLANAYHTTIGLHSTEKIAEANGYIQMIKDPAIRNKAQQLLEANMIKNGITSYKPAELADAQQQLASIQDPTLKRIAEDAVKQRVAKGTPIYTISELTDFINSLSRDLSTQSSSASADIYRKRDKLTSEINNTLTDGIRDQLKVSNEKITQKIKSNNNLPTDIEKPISIGAHADPLTPVDLSTVKNTKKIADIQEEITGNKLKELSQFAEIFVADGTVQLGFEPDNGLSPQTIEQITNLVHDVSPLLYAAFASGDLMSVKFIAGDDYRPYYAPSPREIYMVLPTDRSTSIDQLRSSLVHENTHALMRSVFKDGSKVTPEELSKIKTACTAVSKSAYDSAEIRFRTIPELLSNLQAVANPEHKILFSRLEQAARDGNLDKMLGGKFGDYSDENSNDCVIGDFMSVLHDVAIDEGIDYTKLDYLSGNEAYVKLSREWLAAARTYAVYSKINEAAYVQTNYAYKETLGHSEDSASELVASVTNASISFTEEFGQALHDMSPEDKDAAILALQVSFDLIGERHPSLIKYLIEKEADIITTANQP